MRRILILSHPRSGSSWLGSVIANSDRVRYLREPVLQSRLDTVSDPFCASSGLTRSERRNLRSVIDRTFATNDREILVVKEVTPLLLDDFLEVEGLEVVYLQRHPLAIAASHVALGWLPRETMVDRAGISSSARHILQGLWDSSSDLVRLVAYYGAVESSIDPTFQQRRAVTVRYEDLVSGHLGDLKGLFSDIGVSNSAFASPAIDDEREDAYGVGTNRSVTDRSALTPEDVEESRAAWMRFHPTAYRRDAAWEEFVAED